MLWYWIGLVLLALLGLVLLAAFICCRLAFWVQRTDSDPFAFPRAANMPPTGPKPGSWWRTRWPYPTGMSGPKAQTGCSCTENSTMPHRTLQLC